MAGVSVRVRVMVRVRVLMEVLYLHVLVTVTIFSERIYVKWFAVCGWGESTVLN